MKILGGGKLAWYVSECLGWGPKGGHLGEGALMRRGDAYGSESMPSQERAICSRWIASIDIVASSSVISRNLTLRSVGSRRWMCDVLMLDLELSQCQQTAPPNT